MIKLTEFQLDQLNETVNIGVGKAASSLNIILEHHIDLKVPKIEIFKKNEYHKIIKKLGVSKKIIVEQGFEGEMSGKASLIFHIEHADTLASILSGIDKNSIDLDEIKKGILLEIGNIVINSLIGSMTNLINKHTEFLLPEFVEEDLKQFFKEIENSEDGLIIIAETEFIVEKLNINSFVILLFEIEDINTLIA